MSYRLVLKLVTLNDLEWRDGTFCVILWMQRLLSLQ